ncbi:MAG TPA: MG2 domain-containing protein, partial [Kofleriaceae bacterium]
MIYVNGLTEAQTTYTVTVSHTVLDAFGQQLGIDEPVRFQIGDPQPTFFGPQGMVVLDPAAKKPTLDFFTTNYPNLKVKLFRVEPNDIDAFGFYMQNQWNHDHKPKMPGTQVFDQMIKTSAGHNKLVETSIDLAPALAKTGFGNVVAVVEPFPWDKTWEPPRMIAWVQATKLGLDAFVDSENLVAFATDLNTGKPAADVDLEIRPYGQKAKTDDKGMATIPLGTRPLKGSNFLVAHRGGDTAFLTEYEGWWNSSGSWTKQDRSKQLVWYVTDDRRMYKPGEDVTVKGWLRTIDQAKNGDVGGLNGTVTSVTYKVLDSRNNQIAVGSAPVSAIGGFDAKFVLPKTPNLGGAHVEFSTVGRMGGSYYHGFQIEEFRRPEFEVNAHANQGPFLVGTSADITVDAKYFSGGPLPGAATTWYVTSQQTNFTPPNRDEFIFGDWQPWWGYRRWFDDDNAGYKQPKTWSLAGKTDATGAHVMHLDFLSLNPALPMSVIANASVTDVNRQSWTATQAIIVHPSSLYVGLKAKRPFVEKGQPYSLDVIGVDLDGKAAPNTAIEVKAARLDYQYKKGKYKQVRVDPQTCAVTAAKDPVPCTFQTKTGGEYEVVATIVDAQGRANQTKLTFWVSGGENPPSRDVKQEIVQLIPDKKEYANGDIAEVLVQAPFYPAEAVVTWRRSGIVKLDRISLNGPTTTLKVPIVDAMVPNLY